MIAEVRPAQRRVLLLYPPFGALAFPSIGLSLLKATLEREGIACDIEYLNYDFLDMLPGDAAARMRTFDRLSRRADYSVGDWMFNGELFEQDVVATLDERFREFIIAEGEDEEMLGSCVSIKEIVPHFLDSVMERIEWQRYDVVGLHSIFNQTTACLALAARIKEQHPRIVTLFGGPGAGGDLGRAIVSRFTQIDFAVQGEADRTIVPLIRGIRAGDDVSPIRGLIYRAPPAAGGSGAVEVVSNPVDLVTDLDALPVPDYSEFFARFNDRGYEWGVDVFIPVENARGCWWGQRHHCTFCGLNGETMTFRHKSAERVLAELRAHYEQFGIDRFACVDTILHTSYYRTLLPHLRDGDLNLRVFYEIKANVKREQVQLLADAGLTLLQPGLEHLSTAVLRIMRKGTTYRQNVCMLKWARERDITLFWAILYGFPGEELEHYQEVADRIPSLVHLFPPKALVRVRVDRFSPLFFEPRELGLARIYPAQAYRHVYPFEGPDLDGFAYHFDGDYLDRDPDLNAQIDQVIGPLVRGWNDRFFVHGARLDVIEGCTRSLIRDTRGTGAPRHYVLQGRAQRVYAACDAGRRLERLLELDLDDDVDGEAVTAIIDRLDHDVAISIMLERASEEGWPVRRLGGEGDEQPLDELLELMEQLRIVTRDQDHWISLACRTSDPLALLHRVSSGTRELASMAATRDIALPGG